MGEKSRRALWLVLVTCVLSGPLSHARADALTSRVEALLTAGIEPGSAHSTIAALGEPGERALKDVFASEAPRYVRLRALTVLASFETSSAARYFEALVAAAQQPDARFGELHPARSSLVLRRALEALRTLSGLLRPELDVDAVTACLGHPDAHVRRVAAEVLENLGGPQDPRVDQALGARLAEERSRMVRGSVERALTSRSARSTDPR